MNADTVITIVLQILIYFIAGIAFETLCPLSDVFENPLHKIWMTLLWPLGVVFFLIWAFYTLFKDYILEVKKYYQDKKKETENVPYSPTLEAFRTYYDFIARGKPMDPEILSAVDEETKTQIKRRIEKTFGVYEGFLDEKEITVTDSMIIGTLIGYTGEHCPKCGRMRVEAWTCGRRICDKCHWCIEDQKYYYVMED